MTKFTATGDGYHNRMPDVPATAKTGNGLLKNPSVTPQAGLGDHKLWLYVTGVSSGWSLHGTQSQTQGRRSFNPQHMTQDPLIVRGQMPNQYEYDKLVQFISRHHETANGTEAGSMSAIGSEKGRGAPVSFQLIPYNSIYWLTPPEPKEGEDRIPDRVPDVYRVGKGPQQLMPMDVQGFITEIRAGHARFVNAPTFEFALQVTNDRMDPPVSGLDSLNGSQWYSMFGPFYKAPQEAYGGPNNTTIGTIQDGIDDFVEGAGEVWDATTDAAQAVWDALVDATRVD